NSNSKPLVHRLILVDNPSTRGFFLCRSDAARRTASMTCGFRLKKAQYWEQQGHYIEGVSPNGLNISGRSRPDDFLLSLASTGPDDNVVLSLGASSYCIWPNGTPEPSSTS
ncbi:hypothetical protein AB0395_33020, partial [Streptosporangium sp. NPDC051023]